jgi:hypothetical protein
VRAFAALLLLGACATAAPAPLPPAERLAGCWIDRTGENAVTMRWLADVARPGVLEGRLIEYAADPAQNRTARYTLEPREEHQVMCSHWQPEPICWKVAEGEEGSLEGGRVFIDASQEGLRIAVFSGGIEEVIFEGRRDGCD